MSFSNTAENILVDFVFGRIPLPDGANEFPPLQYEVGLFSNVPPLESSGGIADPIEPGNPSTTPDPGNNYARVLIDNDKNTFTAASVGGIVYNDIEISFPKADGGNWGDIYYVGFFSASNGELIAYGTISDGTNPVYVADGSKIVLNPGDVTISLD
jgi:hypothetical protein